MDKLPTNFEAKGLESPPKPRHWTIREEETGIVHLELLGEGGFGEVHEVRRFCLSLADCETSCSMQRLEKYPPLVFLISRWLLTDLRVLRGR